MTSNLSDSWLLYIILRSCNNPKKGKSTLVLIDYESVVVKATQSCEDVLRDPIDSLKQDSSDLLVFYVVLEAPHNSLHFITLCRDALRAQFMQGPKPYGKEESKASSSNKQSQVRHLDGYNMIKGHIVDRKEVHITSEMCKLALRNAERVYASCMISVDPDYDHTPVPIVVRRPSFTGYEEQCKLVEDEEHSKDPKLDIITALEMVRYAKVREADSKQRDTDIQQLEQCVGVIRGLGVGDACPENVTEEIKQIAEQIRELRRSLKEKKTIYGKAKKEERDIARNEMRSLCSLGKKLQGTIESYLGGLSKQAKILKKVRR